MRVGILSQKAEQTKGADVTIPMMPSYMLRHFNQAIKAKRKTVGYLVERGYEFYICEDIYSEITGGRRYDGSDVIVFKGIRIRMSTTRPFRECNLSCYSHNNENRVKFIVPRPGRERGTPYHTGGEPLWQSILGFINWLRNFPAMVKSVRYTPLGIDEDKPKRKQSDEQMVSLGELFEEYEQCPQMEDRIGE